MRDRVLSSLPKVLLFWFLGLLTSSHRCWSINGISRCNAVCYRWHHVTRFRKRCCCFGLSFASPRRCGGRSFSSSANASRSTPSLSSREWRPRCNVRSWKVYAYTCKHENFAWVLQIRRRFEIILLLQPHRIVGDHSFAARKKDPYTTEQLLEKQGDAVVMFCTDLFGDVPGGKRKRPTGKAEPKLERYFKKSKTK